jgi:hypothetical protein
MEKRQRIQKYKVYFPYLIILHFLWLFSIFTHKKIQMQFLKNTKYEKNTNQKNHKYKMQKIRTQNFKSTKYKKNTQIQKWAREPTPCSFWKARTNLQNNCKANLLYFLNPAIQILYFWIVFLFLYRRPFCSQRRLLKINAQPSIIVHTRLTHSQSIIVHTNNCTTVVARSQA